MTLYMCVYIHTNAYSVFVMQTMLVLCKMWMSGDWLTQLTYCSTLLFNSDPRWTQQTCLAPTQPAPGPQHPSGPAQLNNGVHNHVGATALHK